MTVAVVGEGCKINLTKNARTVVDKEDYKKYGHLKWHLSAKGYACRRPPEGTIFLHRLINNTPNGLQTDHINHNKLDNRKTNLRTVTNQQNHFNRPLDSNNISGHKGVSWDKDRKKWSAQIMFGGKNIFLGRYINIKDAVIARKQGEIKYHGI